MKKINPILSNTYHAFTRLSGTFYTTSLNYLECIAQENVVSKMFT